MRRLSEPSWLLDPQLINFLMCGMPTSSLQGENPQMRSRKHVLFDLLYLLAFLFHAPVKFKISLMLESQTLSLFH